MKHFRKGSIVPRWVGLVLVQHRRAQHRIVFGFNCVYDGRTIKPVGALGSGDALIRVLPKLSEPRKNGTRRKSGLVIRNIRTYQKCPELGYFEESHIEKVKPNEL